MNRSSLSFLVIVFTILALPFTSIAARPHGKEFSINLQDTFVRSNKGNSATIYLKRELKENYPRLDLADLELKRVILIAKSLRGHGTVQLRVGDVVSHAENIAGRQQFFHDARQFTFQRIVLDNPTGDSDGVWQLLLAGNIITREVILVFEDRPRAVSYTLPNAAWGTAMEGERSCGSPSSNAGDGWGAPQNICHGNSEARYTHGYRPIRLFVRPDISVLRQKNIHRITEVEVSVTAIGRNRAYHSHETVSYGIDIGGRNYKGEFSLAPSGVRDGQAHTQTFRVSGSWRPADIRNSVLWIRPDQASADFKLKELKLNILGL